MSSVFRKSVVVTSAAKNKFSTGKIQNMISGDANLIATVPAYLHVCWSAPLRIVIALFMLYQELGFSAFVALALIVVMMPLQKFVVGKFQKMQKKLKEIRDERIKLVNEMIKSINVIKV